MATNTSTQPVPTLMRRCTHKGLTANSLSSTVNVVRRTTTTYLHKSFLLRTVPARVERLDEPSLSAFQLIRDSFDPPISRTEYHVHG